MSDGARLFRRVGLDDCNSSCEGGIRIGSLSLSKWSISRFLDDGEPTHPNMV